MHPRRPFLLILSLLLAVLSALAGAAPVPAQAPAPLLVALPDAVEAGAPLTVSGRAPARAVVVIERRQGGGWTTFARTRATRAGSFRAVVRFASGGPAHLRAVAQGRASRAQTLDVYAWLDLARQPMYSASPAYVDVPVTMAGVRYPHSVLSGDRFASLWWRVDRRCTTIEATVGLDDAEIDRSDRTEAVRTRVYAAPDGSFGGAASPEVTASWGAPVQVRLTGIADAERLVLVGTLEDPDDDGLSIAVGSARVRCNAASLAPIRRDDTSLVP